MSRQVTQEGGRTEICKNLTNRFVFVADVFSLESVLLMIYDFLDFYFFYSGQRTLDSVTFSSRGRLIYLPGEASGILSP